MKLNAIDGIAEILIIIGGINWGLVGAFDFNLVDKLFGTGSALSRIIYCLVGLSALYMIFASMRIKRQAHGQPTGKTI